MNNRKAHGHQGFILVEALVALIVVAVGVLGVGKLNTLLLQGTGLSKARAEAIQIAQDRVETARNFNLQAGCTDAALANSVATVAGVNSNFTVATSYPAFAGAWKAIEVCVTWDGGACNAAGNRVVLRSVISCDGMGTTAQVGTEAASGGRGGFIKTPTGRGQVGGGNYTGTPPGTANRIPGIDREDGTKTYVRDDGVRELIDSTTGKVLLTVGKLGCETSAPEFSTISGKVFVEAKNGEPIASTENLFVLSSDASYCAKLPYQNDWVLPAGTTGNNIKYYYTHYQCYIGAEWWGNIGLVRVDNANANNRACVGSPISSNINTLFSKHPQLSNNRSYRGYRSLGSGIYETKGIGESDTLNTACTAAQGKNVYTYTPNHLRNHHFVHTVITGRATDSACGTAETTLNNYPTTGSLGSTNIDPSVSVSGGAKTVSANNNPGKFYCMSNDNGVTCPDLSTNPTIPSTLVHGTITRYDGAVLSGIDSTTSDCTTATISGNSTQYTYSCQIDWSGFIGGSWSGTIDFTASGGATLCPSGAAATVVPSTSYVAYTITDKNASVDPNAIKFSEIPMAVTDVTINFDVKANCTGLGQPDLTSWKLTGTGSNVVASFSWSAITNATGYKIRTCTGSTTCDPSTGTPTTQTATTYSAPTTGAYQMCVSVTATNGTIDGPSSPKKCITRTSNNKYTFG